MNHKTQKREDDPNYEKKNLLGLWFKLDNQSKLMPQGNKSDVLFHIITKPKLHLPTYNSEIKHVI